MRNQNGFTLVEILVSLVIMAVAVMGALQSVNHVYQLNELNEYSLIGINAAQGMMNEIRNVNFEDIIGNYNNMQFSLNELTAMGISHSGVVYASELVPDYLIQVKVVVCWEQKNHSIGEDQNFNGQLDAGEDENGNGELDSNCMLEAAVVYR